MLINIIIIIIIFMSTQNFSALEKAGHILVLPFRWLQLVPRTSINLIQKETIPEVILRKVLGTSSSGICLHWTP